MKNRSLKRNIAYNGIASGLSKVVRVADQLLLVPFFLTAWGTAYYGEWLTLTVIPSVLSFADLGFGTAAANAFVLAYSGGNYAASSNIYKTGIRLISISVMSGIVVAVLILVLANSFGLLQKSLINSIDATWALIFLMASTLVSFYNQFFDAFYRCRHESSLSINIMTVGGLFKIGVGILLLISGYGIVIYAMGHLIVTIIWNAGYSIYGRSRVDNLPRGHWSKEIARDISKKGIAFMFYPIWQSIYFQGSTFIVRLFLGPEMVALFNTARTACRSVNQIYAVVNTAVFPELQMAFGCNDKTLVRKLYVRSYQVELTIAFIGALLLFVYGQSIYTWWTMKTIVVPSNVWNVFVFGIILNALWWTASMVFKASNMPYRFAMYSLIGSIISVLAMSVFSSCLGLLGAVIGFVLFDIIMVLTVIPSANKIVGIDNEPKGLSQK